MATHSSPNFLSFKEKSSARRARRIVAAFLIFSAVLTSAYTALSLYIATQLVYAPQQPLYATPAFFGMQFHRITFPSREDHVQLRGWFIPGVLPGGHLTAQRTIIMVHGDRTNRADQGAGLLKLSVAFAQHGFAVLAFDMRGAGESPPAPLSLGYFEQRDVLGAVDFLRSGPLPYPRLGRPRVIGGWGVSMGAATLLLAAAREPAIRAIRPIDVVARIAPRPLFFIHGDADTLIPPSNSCTLAAAARVPHSDVQF